LAAIVSHGCARTVYDSHGNVVEQWNPPTAEELQAYIDLMERLEPLFNRMMNGDATEEDKDTVDKLLEYYNSPEGQEALTAANQRTIAMIEALRRLRRENE